MTNWMCKMCTKQTISFVVDRYEAIITCFVNCKIHFLWKIKKCGFSKIFLILRLFVKKTLHSQEILLLKIRMLVSVGPDMSIGVTIKNKLNWILMYMYNTSFV